MCIADELEWVEIDVRLSKDGIHVLAHDDQLDGKTNGRGRVSDSTVEQLHALDAGSWFARRYANTRLLTLAQALEIAKGRINLYLDCKQADPEKLVADVRAAGMTRKETAGIAWFSIAGSRLKPVMRRLSHDEVLLPPGLIFGRVESAKCRTSSRHRV